jgi:hypothetical protein
LASARDTDDPFLLGGSRVIFLAAVMDWVGEAQPTEDDLAGSSVIEQGKAHVKIIQRTGGVILGCRRLHLDAITGLREVTHRGGGTVYLYEGATRLRAATREEAASLPVLSTWGLDVIRIVAEQRFVADHAQHAVG